MNNISYLLQHDALYHWFANSLSIICSEFYNILVGAFFIHVSFSHTSNHNICRLPFYFTLYQKHFSVLLHGVRNHRLLVVP